MRSLICKAKSVFEIEIDAIKNLSNRIDESFDLVCKTLLECNGKVIFIGIGKSGHIASKIASTFASTGTPAFFIHPSEAGHGDLGMISKNDIVVVISYSGESSEITTLLPIIKRQNIPIIALTGNKSSTIAKESNLHLDVSVKVEACPHNLAPTSSTTTVLAMGDALAISLLEAKGFSPNDFAKSHPSGALGRKLLTTVNDVMKKDDDIPFVSKELTLPKALIVMSEKSLGMVLVVDKNKKLLGIFTDGDLRRLLATKVDIHKLKMQDIMTADCKSMTAEKPAVLAVELMEEFSLNSLAVVDDNNKVIGALNMHNLMHSKVI